MPTIRLVTDEDMRAITSQNLEEITRLPHLYIPTDEPDGMRSWGIALERGFADYLRLFPDALVAPHSFGETASRADLIYHGAEPAADYGVKAR